MVISSADKISSCAVLAMDTPIRKIDALSGLGRSPGGHGSTARMTDFHHLFCLLDNPGKIPALSVYSPLNWVKYCAFLQSFPYPAPITGPVTARTSVTPRPGYIFPACLLMRESFMFEVNPVLNKLKELSERTELLRGYL